MYSGGIVSLLGNVTIENGSRIIGNTNNGPGGGIACNFGARVTVTGGSQIMMNQGAALGGGIVNFTAFKGGIDVSGASQVSQNKLKNAETIAQVIETLLSIVFGNTSFGNFADAVGGIGGAAMRGALRDVDRAAQAARPSLQLAKTELMDPQGVLVAGGGIATLLTGGEVSVTEGSRVENNQSGVSVPGGVAGAVGIDGGIFTLLSPITLDGASVSTNQTLQGDGGRIVVQATDHPRRRNRSKQFRRIRRRGNLGRGWTLDQRQLRQQQLRSH
jgi:hypothetical protein